VPGRGSDEFVEQVLQVLLPTTGVGRGFASLEHVGFQVLEAGLARLDLRADARVPGGVLLLQDVGNRTA
jgi:hypothetical protein